MGTTATRLLVVDDDRLVLATIGRGLWGHGYAVTTADGGEAALRIARTKTFDAAILDVSLPGMSGIEVGRELRARYGLPCLFLSAHDDAGLVAQAVADGGCTYLVKPLNAAQLVPAIELAVARAREMHAMISTMAHLERALAARREVSMAIGVLMERLGMDQQAAFEELRRQARRQRRKLEDYCAELLAPPQPPAAAEDSP